MNHAFILTQPIGNNFGGVLQALLLSKAIEKLGLKPVLINYTWPSKIKIVKPLQLLIHRFPAVALLFNKQKYHFLKICKNFVIQ